MIKLSKRSRKKCKDDIETFCNDLESTELANCMIRNYNNLSQSCIHSIEDVNKLMNTPINNPSKTSIESEINKMNQYLKSIKKGFKKILKQKHKVSEKQYRGSGSGSDSDSDINKYKIEEAQTIPQYKNKEKIPVYIYTKNEKKDIKKIEDNCDTFLGKLWRIGIRVPNKFIDDIFEGYDSLYPKIIKITICLFSIITVLGFLPQAYYIFITDNLIKPIIKLLLNSFGYGTISIMYIIADISKTIITYSFEGISDVFFKILEIYKNDKTIIFSGVIGLLTVLLSFLLVISSYYKNIKKDEDERLYHAKISGNFIDVDDETNHDYLLKKMIKNADDRLHHAKLSGTVIDVDDDVDS